jgi:hypothetical protein
LHRIVIDYSKVGFYTLIEGAAADLAEDLGEGATASGTTVTVADDVTIDASETVTVPAGVTLSVSADSTITLGAGASLVLTGGPATASGATLAGASLTGTGKIVAAHTEISGAWQAVDTVNTTTVTITATDADASVITSSAATVSLTAGASGVITQAAGTGNELTIATDTTIALGGTGEKLGEIVLKGAAADTGKLTLIGTITTGNASANPAVTAAALSTDGTTTVAISAYTKIGVANLVGDGTKAKVEPTNAVSGADAAAAGKIVKLTGESGATISAGTSDGTISGATATVATT